MNFIITNTEVEFFKIEILIHFLPFETELVKYTSSGLGSLLQASVTVWCSPEAVVKRSSMPFIHDDRPTLLQGLWEKELFAF